VFKGGTSTTTSGNGADSYNGVRNQGVAGGTGDQGNPNGNPNSDSYKGNAASGNGGGGGTGGVNIRSGLTGRRITKYPSFEDEFNEAATVMVNITVDQAGNVINATINPKGTSTTNINIRNIARQKAYLLKLNTGSATEQTGTIAFVFKLRG
jgi:outer membrane biosynthesis protein TonB